MKYEPVSELGRCEIEEAIAQDDQERLQVAVLSVALHSSDPEWAERICLELAQHDHPVIRGNAVLGFGHTARLHGRLTEQVVKPIIETALSDSNEYIRGQAVSAADDVEFFLKWGCQRPA